MSYDLTSSYPFDERDLTEIEWATMARAWLINGVITTDFFNPAGLNEFAVSANGASMSCAVATGRCWIDGEYGEATVAGSVTHGTADPSNPRIDRVIIRLDRVLAKMYVTILPGTPAASPAAPALTNSLLYYDIPLAQVLVGTGVTTIAAANVTDERIRVFKDRGSPFGDGSDGNVVISTTVTLTRDMQYNDLRILSGGILKPAGFLVKVAGVLTVDAGGIIDGNGGDGGNASASIPGSAGQPSYASSPHWPPGGVGGIGGDSLGAGTANGAVGANAAPVLTASHLALLWKPGGGASGGAAHGLTPVASGGAAAWFGGFFGGVGKTASGAGSFDESGGGGGGGAGVMVFYCRTINNGGTIRCNGGNGGNGVTSGSPSGGGGGGAGGTIAIFYRTTTGSGLGTRTVTGGAAGLYGGGGSAGGAGQSLSYQI